MNFKDKLVLETILGQKILPYQEIIFDSLNKKEKLELIHDPNKLRGFRTQSILFDEMMYSGSE